MNPETSSIYEAFIQTISCPCEVCGGIPGFEVSIENGRVLDVMCDSKDDEQLSRCPLLAYEAVPRPEAFGFLTGSTRGAAGGGSQPASSAE